MAAQPEFFFWEPIVLVQRLVISGWIQLMTPSLKMLRITVALAICFTYTGVLMFYKPYLAFSVDMFAVITQYLLCFCFLSALNMKVSRHCVCVLADVRESSRAIALVFSFTTWQTPQASPKRSLGWAAPVSELVGG